MKEINEIQKNISVNEEHSVQNNNIYKIVVDSHTHSISSGHAYSTIQEMAREANVNGIEMFVITDHGPTMKGAPYLYHFGNLKVIPQELYGARILKGVEANIIGYDGSIDMPLEYLKRLDYVIASFHDICISPGTIEENTNAFIGALKNPWIDAIGHPGNPQFQVDIDRVVSAAKEYNKLIEINNHSFYVRTGSEDNCFQFAKKCNEKNVKVVCGSDAHISFGIGKFENVIEVFNKVGMKEELIISTSVEKFLNHLENRKR